MTDGDELKVYRYPSMSKILESGFLLHVAEGHIKERQITVLHGKEGSGKTTFLNLMAGIMTPDNMGTSFRSELFGASYLFQSIAVDCFLYDDDSVRDLFRRFVRCFYEYPKFVSDVMVPLKIPRLMDRTASSLSKAEIYNVALCIHLAQPASVYLLDEPTFHMDPEQRMVAARVIKQFIQQEKKTAIVVEHDLEAAAFLADKVVVLEGTPYVSCVASSPIDRDESPLA